MSEDITPNRTLDAQGLYCPEPIFKTRTEIEQIEVGQILEVLADDPAAEADMKSWTKRVGHTLLKFEKLEGNTLRFLVRREK